MERAVRSLFAVITAVIVAMVVFGSTADAKFDLAGRRRGAFDETLRARYLYQDSEQQLSAISQPSHKAGSGELDRYMFTVSQCLAHALNAYFLIGPNQVVPPSNIDVADGIRRIPDDSFGEMLYPSSLDDLVAAGIIPGVPWRPTDAYERSWGNSAVHSRFYPFTIVYYPVITKKCYWRATGGYPEGALLLCYGATEASKPDPENQNDLSWVLSILGKDKLPAGVVGYFAQIADEPAKPK